MLMHYEGCKWWSLTVRWTLLSRLGVKDLGKRGQGGGQEFTTGLGEHDAWFTIFVAESQQGLTIKG